ncbi:MAG: prolyl aminopeptidase [Rhodocyclaceae bacterium]|nr:MAG: prolyl aminopeptidase [Rhodocyclaceae bacterium]
MRQCGVRRPRAATLYPQIEPYANGYLQVDGGHQIYWEMCGNPLGTPALFLHGGPGGGCTAGDRRWFDPQRYRIVLFDQRGCGRSRPTASLAANTTAHLIRDIETLRVHCGIESWLLLGGSWGATLALAYAEDHPQRVRAMVLRGVFTARRKELRWLYGRGASLLFPDAWESFLAPIPAVERRDLIGAYHARLTCGDATPEMCAANAWCAWEDRLATLEPQPPAYLIDAPATLALARIESHYFKHDSFLAEGQLIANAELLQGIPCVMVQGRHDAVTPPGAARDLARALPRATLQMVEDAGHASSEPGILRRLIMATDGFACQER